MICLFDKKIIHIIQKDLFLFLFFIFKYYIFKYSFNKFFFLFFYTLNLYKNYINIKFFYDFFFFFLWKKLYVFLNYFFLFKNNLFIKVKDIKLFIFLEFIYKKIKIISFKFDYFFKNNNNFKIFYFFDFYLRIDFFIFITYKNYVEYIRLYKYNEYLNKNYILLKYPLIKKIIITSWRIRLKKRYLPYKVLLPFLNYYHLYMIKIDPKINNIIKLNYFDIFIFFNNFNFLKLLNIFNNKILYFIIFIFKKYFVIYFLLFIYEMWLKHIILDDWWEIKKFRAITLMRLHWFLIRYKFNIKIWLFMLLFIYVLKIFMLNNIYLFNLQFLKLIPLKLINFNVFGIKY